MKLTWIIQDEIFDDNQEKLCKEITRQGFNLKIIEYSPYYQSKFNWLDSIKGPSLFYGSLNLGVLLLKESLYPGVYCDLGKYRCEYYYPRLNKYLLNSDGFMLPFGCLGDYNLPDSVISDDCVFIRPCDGFKSFTGQVVDLSDDLWYNRLKAYESLPEDLCLIAKPYKINREWRLIIGNGEVITGSEYKSENRNLPNEVIDYANNLLSETQFNPEPLWTLDICESGGEYFVLEIGSFSCAGFYSSDLEKIVSKASDIAIADWRDIYEW